MDDYYKGVLFSLSGNIAINLGHHLKVIGQTNTQSKLVHSKTKSRCDCNRKILWWVIGTIFFLCGSFSNAYALAFAPQTLLASIGSIQFVVNLMCSAVFYKARLRLTHFLGTIAVISGCLIIVFGFSPQSDDSRVTVVSLLENFNSFTYKTYLIICITVFVLSIFCQYFDFMPTLSLGSSTNGNNIGLHKQKHSHLQSGSWLGGIFFSLFSALPGTQSVVLGKTLAILMRRYFAGKLSIFFPFDLITFIFIVVTTFSWLTTIAWWLYRQHESMTKFNPVFIVPMNQVMWITFSTISGGIFYREFESASLVQWVSLIGGLILNYSGLFHLVTDMGGSHQLKRNTEPKQKKSNMDTYGTIEITHSSQHHSRHSPQHRRGGGSSSNATSSETQPFLDKTSDATDDTRPQHCNMDTRPHKKRKKRKKKHRKHKKHRLQRMQESMQRQQSMPETSQSMFELSTQPMPMTNVDSQKNKHDNANSNATLENVTSSNTTVSNDSSTNMNMNMNMTNSMDNPPPSTVMSDSGLSPTDTVEISIGSATESKSTLRRKHKPASNATLNNIDAVSESASLIINAAPSTDDNNTPPTLTHLMPPPGVQNVVSRAYQWVNRAVGRKGE